MTVEERHQLCEWLNCRARAVVGIEAQWTLFDFLTQYTCRAHFEPMVDLLSWRKVDGEPPLEMHATWWDDRMDRTAEVSSAEG